MSANRRFWLLIPLIAAFAAPPAAGFSYPLSPEAVRDAYFLGTGDAAKRAEAFAKYTHTFPVARTGPYVGAIEFETPYVVVADQIAQRLGDYHAPDAEQDFLGKPGACHVVVQVYFPYDEYDNFTVQLFQAGRKIESRSKHGTFLYSDRDWPAVGVRMEIKYSADRIDPSEPVNVRVAIDQGPIVRTTFDLSQLR
jgi:hypothetical protein